MAGKRSPVRAKAGSSREEAAAKRHLFVEAFVVNGGNATKAAVAAGFSEKTAYSSGQRLLKHVEVIQILNNRRTAIAESTELSTNEIMSDMARTLRFDPRKLFEQDGQIKRVIDMDDDTALCLTGIDVVVSSGKDGEGSTTTHKLKWDSKAQARDQALRVFGMYEKDNKQKNGALDGLPRELIQLMVDRLKVLGNGIR